MSTVKDGVAVVIRGGLFGCAILSSLSFAIAAEPPEVDQPIIRAVQPVAKVAQPNAKAAQQVAKDNEKLSEQPSDSLNSTHKQIGDIKIRGERGGHQLQTFCLDPQGNVIAVVGPPRSNGNAKLAGKNNSSEIRVFDGEGKPLRDWSVSFAVQAVAVAPNGTIFASGNGKIARYDAEGKELASVDLPYIEKLLGDSDALREQAQAQIDAQKERIDAQTKELREQVDEQKVKLAELQEEIETKDKDDVTAAEKRKIKRAESGIKALENQIKAIEQSSGRSAPASIDEVIAQLTSRLKITNALAVSDKDVFVASGVVKGYGYGIWRMSHDFAEPERIVTGLSGCCGQMDIHCCDEDVYVAENSRKSVVRFDREGKKLATFGKGERNGGLGAGFGGCCNPMNLCFNSAGNVLTAESEGYIKEFTKDGKYVGIIGQAKVSGGCKNVAIAVSPDGERAYFFDLQGSRIVILGKKDVATEDNSNS